MFNKQKNFRSFPVIIVTLKAGQEFNLNFYKRHTCFLLLLLFTFFLFTRIFIGLRITQSSILFVLLHPRCIYVNCLSPKLTYP